MANALITIDLLAKQLIQKLITLRYLGRNHTQIQILLSQTSVHNMHITVTWPFPEGDQYIQVGLSCSTLFYGSVDSIL